MHVKDRHTDTDRQADDHGDGRTDNQSDRQIERETMKFGPLQNSLAPPLFTDTREQINFTHKEFGDVKISKSWQMEKITHKEYR